MWNEILKQAAQTGATRGKLPAPSQALLREVWPTLVGDQLARVSSPVGLADEILVIKARDQALADEWQRSPHQLLRRISPLIPWPVSGLTVTVDPQAGVTAAPKPTDRADANTDSLASDDGAAASLPNADGIDGELQSILEAIAAHRRHKP